MLRASRLVVPRTAREVGLRSNEPEITSASHAAKSVVVNRGQARRRVHRAKERGEKIGVSASLRQKG